MSKVPFRWCESFFVYPQRPAVILTFSNFLESNNTMIDDLAAKTPSTVRYAAGTGTVRRAPLLVLTEPREPKYQFPLDGPRKSLLRLYKEIVLVPSAAYAQIISQILKCCSDGSVENFMICCFSAVESLQTIIY